MTRRDSKTRQVGFTLPELLVAGVVLLIFVAVMLVLVRPTNYDASRRNAERQTELAQIMQAIVAYKKTNGQLPLHLTAAEAVIGNTDNDELTLCDDLVPKYLADLPYDPKAGLKLDDTQACNGEDQIFVTGYTARIEGSRVILTAPKTEGSTPATVERWFPLF